MLQKIKQKVMWIVLAMFILPIMVFAQDVPDKPDYMFPAILLTIVGGVAPLLISFVTKAIKESWARYLIAAFLSGAIAFIGILMLGISLTLTNIAVVLPAFIFLTNTAWKLWWHKLLKK